MEYRQLGFKEREILLEALDFNHLNLKCQHCGDDTEYENCCIMPAFKTKKLATILCDSILCLAWYITELEHKAQADGDDAKT